MHYEAMQFLQQVARNLEEKPYAICEFGSYNVNGSARDAFRVFSRYVGIDVRPGPDVDMVCSSHDFRGGEGFDICVTAETLEHDPNPERTIQSAWDALKPGGLFVLTAAAPPRVPHSVNGVTGFDIRTEHYANIDPDDLRNWLRNWVDITIKHDVLHGDVYATARKPIF